jgi:hypothetical protein
LVNIELGSIILTKWFNCVYSKTIEHLTLFKMVDLYGGKYFETLSCIMGSIFSKKWHLLHRDLLRYFISHMFYSYILGLRILNLLETFGFWYLIFDKSKQLYLLFLRCTLSRLDFVPLSWSHCNRKTFVFFFLRPCIHLF